MVPRRAPAGALPLCAALAALLCAVVIAVVVAGGNDPLGVDRAAHDWALRERTPGGEDVLTVITDSGTRVPAVVLAMTAGALVARNVWWLGAVTGGAALLVAQLLRYGLVLAIDRPRPPESHWAMHVNNPALPSGHATTSALVAIGLAVALWPHCRRPLTRALAVGVPALWAVAVGFSRVYLGVHWPTDVLAGWLLATALSCAFLPLIGRYLRRAATG
ncbi:phosphatase PAP2 family protein [Streptomyces sp. 3MP-14]|uniref:Phosphatase PAP2 family protein n=1 Tax=Streptomyces mimosae TaxID=2586635 RepID=A0A5N6A0Q8_9ACTN|nr:MULTISPECIES: phosphatase PAP2 family protein [Streptomyces]KAB8161782.1 phosphatase PAP2 family protein [Streptomyces mimosae]KAB8174950.1 phosphatase PAP2 family protein [Streptomyces sp. 3MP-14]